MQSWDNEIYMVAREEPNTSLSGSLCGTMILRFPRLDRKQLIAITVGTLDCRPR